MTWAARYSRTIEPELTIWRDGMEVESLTLDEVVRIAVRWPVDADALDDLRADIAARVDLRECDQPACTLHAIGQGLCVLHGGRDEL